jgi:hypothetical protein
MAYTAHEMGHAVFLKLAKIEYESGVNEVGQYFKMKNASKNQAIACAMVGVLAGFIPFIFVFSYTALVFYLVGCYRDIFLIARLKL